MLNLILGDLGADKGAEGKSKRAEKCGTKKSKEQQFRLSLVPTICPWVSEDGNDSLVT